MGKPPHHAPDHARSVVSKHHYSADERELGTNSVGPPVLTQHISINTTPGDSGSVKDTVGRTSPSARSLNGKHHVVHEGGSGGDTAHPAAHKSAYGANTSSAHAAAPSNKSEAEGSGDTAIGEVDAGPTEKPPIAKRLVAGSKRFVIHTKNALLYSWLNVLLIFVPIGIIVDAIHLSPTIIFAVNAVAIVPLAGLLAHATETVASHLGSNIGALLNVTFGNAVELIIFIIALTKNEVSVIQAALLGSILSNLLLILGMAFLLGGLRYREQIYNSTVTQMSACLLTLSVASLVLPTAFHASFKDDSLAQAEADTKILEVSRGTSVILLLIYVLYLVFQLKSHAYMYEATPQHVIDEESHPGVLHAMLESSSSSSDSDSDTSSSDSSTSHGTAGRRLRRMIKGRRRRKSSASTSTAGTVSMPSVNSPSNGERENYFEGRSQQTSRRSSPLGVIVSGDEADADAENDNPSAPRIRDFVSLDGEAISSAYHRRRHQRKHRRKYRKHRHMDEEKAEAAKEADLAQVSEVQPVVEPIPGDLVEPSEMPLPLDQNAAKRPFNLRSLSTRGTVIAPGLSRMLTNNVFVTPPPLPAHSPAVQRLRSEGVLRRTNSLPDRLNKQPNKPEPQPMYALQPTVSRRTPAPHVRIAAVVGHGETVAISDKHEMSRTAAVVLLLCSTALVAVCAEFMVSAIPDMLANNSTISEAFIGLIILPIVGNAAEHVTAVTVAAKNKMDLAIGVAVGSSIQIALFVTPLIVLLGWIMNVAMSLYFNIFETVSLFVAVLVVNFLCLDGRSNYLEGALLIAAYVIIALVAFYYPGTDSRSAIGGGDIASV